MQPTVLYRYFLGFFGIKTPEAYKKQANTYDLLKFIALLGMIIDHVGEYFFPEINELRAIGRVAFPLFLFLVGYSGKFSVRYNLLILGILITALNLYAKNEAVTLDILITIFLTLLALKIINRFNYLKIDKCYELFIVFAFWNLGAMPIFAYGTISVLFALAGHYCRNFPENKNYRIFLLLTILYNFIFQSFFWKDPTLITTAIFFTISIAIYLLLYKFKNVEIDYNNYWLVAAISRNSLAIYFFHKVAFICAAIRTNY